MSYSNIFLTDFTPVFQGILKAKGMAPEKLELAVIDEEPESPLPPEQVILMEIPATGIFIGKVKLTPILPLRDNDTVEENSMLSISLIAKGLQTGNTLTRPSVNEPISGWSPKSPRSKLTSLPVTRTL